MFDKHIFIDTCADELGGGSDNILFINARIKSYLDTPEGPIMRPIGNTLGNETKRDDSVELSRFFCFLGSMKKLMRILIVFGLVGLLFGCGGEGEESASEMGGNVSGQTTKVKKNIMKLKATGSCVKCTLTGADLNGANLKEADLEGAYLRDADLSDAYLWGADLVEANLRDADLNGADLSGANLQGVNLSGANLQGANLFAADLNGANLFAAYLSGANLQGTNLKGANLKRTNLKDVENLDDAILCKTIMSWGEENKDCK